MGSNKGYLSAGGGRIVISPAAMIPEFFELIQFDYELKFVKLGC